MPGSQKSDLGGNSFVEKSRAVDASPHSGIPDIVKHDVQQPVDKDISPEKWQKENSSLVDEVGKRCEGIRLKLRNREKDELPAEYNTRMITAISDMNGLLNDIEKYYGAFCDHEAKIDDFTISPIDKLRMKGKNRDHLRVLDSAIDRVKRLKEQFDPYIPALKAVDDVIQVFHAYVTCSEHFAFIDRVTKDIRKDYDMAKGTGKAWLEPAEAQYYRSILERTGTFCAQKRLQFAGWDGKITSLKSSADEIRQHDKAFADDLFSVYGQSLNYKSVVLRCRAKYRERQSACKELLTKLTELEASFPGEQVATVEKQDSPVNSVDIETFTRVLLDKFPGADKKTVELLAVSRSVFMNTAYCDKVMLALDAEMRQSGESVDQMLSRREAEIGFADRVVIDKELNTRKFHAVLRQGTQMFDVGVDALHGSHSHRFQWQILRQYFSTEEGQSRLGDRTLVDFYKSVGDDTLRNGRGDMAWLFTFDVVPIKDPLIPDGSNIKRWRMTRYAAPENITVHLLDNGVLPPGPLKTQLQLDRLYQDHAGSACILSDQHAKKGLYEAIEEQKSKVDPLPFYYSIQWDSTASGAMHPPERLDPMKLRTHMNRLELEDMYASLQVSIPTPYDIDGDFAQALKKIREEEASYTTQE